MIFVKNGRTGNKRHQLHVVASVQRQVLHLPLVNHPRYFARRRIYSLANAAANLHCLGQLSNFQGHVLRQARVGRQHHAGLLSFLETIADHQNRISAHGQISGGVKSVLIRSDRADEVSGHIRDCDIGVGDRTAVTVFHRAGDAPEYGLT